MLFPDPTPVKKHPSIKYLGATFSAALDLGTIIRQKIADVAQLLRTLAPLWSDPQIGTAWKLVVVFNAVIRSRVFCTLDTLKPATSHQRSLATLYFQGLRKILRKHSTYIDRTWRHERLPEVANRTARKIRGTTARHRPFSKYYEQRRRKLLGHLLRALALKIRRLAVLTEEDRPHKPRRKEAGGKTEIHVASGKSKGSHG